MLRVPESEETRLKALEALLEALEEAELLGQVTAVRLENTQLTARYLDRYDVRMALNADFPYNLRLMRSVRARIEEENGGEARGTIDLTRDKYDAAYSPEAGDASP